MSHFTTHDDLSIHYEAQGFDHSGPVLVFLNGMTQTTRHWTTHSRRLRDHRPVLTYDARGQGQSDPPPTVPSLDTHVADLVALLDHLDMDAVDLVGFSHGARVALGMAASHRDRLRRLVLCGATAHPTAVAKTIVRSWAEILELGGLPALAWASLPTIIGEAFLEKNGFLLDNIVRASVERNSEIGTRRLLEGLQEFPPLANMATEVEAPTLVISGDGDVLAPAEGARELAELCGGTHALVDDSGHTVPIEQPEAFRRLITDFLDSDQH